MTDVFDLQSTLQELKIAEEELRAQNEELLAAQTALDRGRERYAQLFESAPDASFVTDEHGKILEANSAATAMLGLRRDVLEKKLLVSLLSPGDRRALRTALLAFARGEKLVERDLRIRRSSGEEVVAHARATVLPQRDGAPRLRWSLRDVTEQRSKETELRLLNDELERRVALRGGELERQRLLLNAVVDQIPLGLMILDATGNLLVANAEAKRILGTTKLGGEADAWQGFRPDGTRYAPDDWPIARSLKTQEVVKGERALVVRPDGETIVIEINSAPVRDPEGNVSAAVAVFDDVTDAERREQAERDFVTNAAHQLRSPVASMLGAVEVLQAGAKELPEERERFLAHLERDCARLARATKALLTLARAQSGREAARHEILELRPLLEEVAAGLRPRAGVELVVDCPPELVLLADRGLVMEALANVGLNAVQHTAKGRIRLIGRPTDDGRVVIEVADTGPGMAPEVRERAVERFYRSEDDRDGFGLGLAIAAQALTATGATLELESEPNRGTVARMTFRAGRLVTA